MPFYERGAMRGDKAKLKALPVIFTLNFILNFNVPPKKYKN